MIVATVFPRYVNNDSETFVPDYWVSEVIVLWSDDVSETSFQWGAIYYIEDLNNVPSDKQIADELWETMPENVKMFINLYNNETTREEALVFLAIGGVNSLKLGDCGND